MRIPVVQKCHGLQKLLPLCLKPDFADFQNLPETLQRVNAGLCSHIPCTHLLLGLETDMALSVTPQHAPNLPRGASKSLLVESVLLVKQYNRKKSVLQLILLHILIFLIYFSSCFVKVCP